MGYRPQRFSGHRRLSNLLITLMSLSMITGCLSQLDPLLAPPPAEVTVKMDFLHRPLPEIPLPNDIATRFDPTSATQRRINASMLAPTHLEREVRSLIDELDGWGVNQPITIPFTGPLDVRSILNGHRDPLYDLDNDVIFLINVTQGSEHYGELVRLDLGEGNYPVILEDLNGYGERDPRGWTNSIVFEEADEDLNRDGVLGLGEDLNGNGMLDEGEDADGDGELTPPEDLDADGVLDRPNYLPCGALDREDIPCDAEGKWLSPARDQLSQRADALMTFYERETNTLIVRAMESLRERSTYAVVLTRRILAADGAPIGSPFESYHHLSQTEALRGVGSLLPEGLSEEDIAFAFTFTTQSLGSSWVAVREGLYGQGVQGHIARQVPAKLASIEPLRDVESGRFGEGANPYIMKSEDFLPPFRIIAQQLLRQDPNSQSFEAQLGAQEAVGYHVIGSFLSPQLFRRAPRGEDPNDVSKWLPLNLQSWPQDLDSIPAEVTTEQVWFWMMMPAPEYRKPGPVPVAIVGHGYASNRFESLAFAGNFAQHGIATVAIDCPSHGLGLNQEEEELASMLTSVFGLEGFLRAANLGRIFDQDRNGSFDSGVDYWTSYVFHTRDVVRQCVLDHMQLIRLLKSFDGQTRWEYDLNGDGEAELAGDFNADGEVDIGADSMLSVTGASLGGIISTLVASLEPAVTVAVPISGGGGLGDIGVRSLQGGVREAVILRVMGQMVLGERDDQETRVYGLMTELNDDGRRDFGRLPALKQYDSLVLENLDNGRVGCAYVQEDGDFRVNVESDVGDRLKLIAYRGPQIDWRGGGEPECTLRDPERAKEYEIGRLTQFATEVKFLGETYRSGSPLVALSEGFGERRATPGLRRFLGLGQLVLDGGDPASYARHVLREPLKYPHLEEETGSHILIVTTMGDMNVPASAGATLGRSAGLIDYLTPLPEHQGRSANKVLLDSYTIEAVHSLKRHTDRDGQGVHLDIELFSAGEDVWTSSEVPRSSIPLRSGLSKKDTLGGYSGAIFPYSSPEGQHGVNFPGMDRDIYIERCRETCVIEGEPIPEDEEVSEEVAECLSGCDLAYQGKFDVGLFFFNLLGEYLSSGGAKWNPEGVSDR